tara:strand:- start:448 stop:663 length:216 start_codon:yes stop_codon:yes gene_type:complete
LKLALLLSNKIGRAANMPNAMRENESVVNLATPHSDEAKAIIDNSIEITLYSNILSKLIFLIKLLIKNYCS